MRNKSGAQYAASKYIEFTVNKPMSLLDFIMESMKGISRNKAKDILTGHGITVDRKSVSQYNYELRPGMVVRVSKHKRNNELKNKYVKIVYEDKDLIVIEKSAGILSMPAVAQQFSIKTVLDEYFTRRHFKCTSPRSTPFGPRHIRFDNVCKKYRGTTDFGRTLAGNRDRP